MIFVVVGNARQGFPRLLAAVEELAANGAFDGERVVLQSGHTAFESSACEQRDFIAMDEFESLIQEADVVVTHGGNGSIMQALAAGKIPVVMLRRKRFDEHIDDHQLDLARTLADEGRVIIVEDRADLAAAIREARGKPPPHRSSMDSCMSELVEEALRTLIRDNA